MVSITGPVQEGWYPVLCDNTNGWVSAEFVLLEGEGSTPPEGVIEEPTEAVTEPIDIEIVPPVTDESTEAPIVMPTSEPEPVVTTWEQMVNVSADTSVTASGAPADPALLAVGGPDEAVAVLSFDVNGIESGTVVSATLVLTGAISGPAGNVNVLPGLWVDENVASWSTVQNGSGVGQIDWLVERTEIPIDVTGVVTGDGVVTFVVTGSPEGVAAITSREGGAPAYLVLIIEDRA
jgi:hypothetical protein